MGRKITIGDMCEFAKQKNGKCLSNEYVDAKTKLLWKCSYGHQWEATSSIVKRGSWCRKCSFIRKPVFTIADMNSLVKEKRGRCLSKKYLNAKAKLSWICEKEHKWEATYDSIKSGSWCPTCGKDRSANKRLIGIKPMKELAKDRGGECLSDVYVGAHSHLNWRCSCGHIWKAAPTGIISGSWCPRCAGKMRKTIEDMQAVAKSRGGRCLSSKYTNQKSKLRWECAEGHRWSATASNVSFSAWCPRCAGKLVTINDMQKIANTRGGKCLSKRYVNNTKKMRWECKHGHKWEMNSAGINRGGWCPECSSGVSERICRAYFQQIFGCRFPRVRPKWLKNREGNLLELDGYCLKLKLAFEHQGEQHYTTDSLFISTEEQLRKRKRDDAAKVRMCKKHGVRLIAIPELFSRTKLDDLRQLIFNECKKLKVRRPKDFLTKKINLKRAYSTPGSQVEFELLSKIARGKGGTLLSKHYVNTLHHLHWECKNGYRWHAVPGNIKRHDTWCPYCAGNISLTIEDFQIIATSHGGECLSSSYEGINKKLHWRCKEGHKWWSSASSIKHQNTWCPVCSNARRGETARLGIEAMRDLAKKHDGKCLSENYVNVFTKLRWECKEGHQWEANAATIKNKGLWCQECRPHTRESQPHRLTLEQMQEIAEERGGQCLSKEYVNRHTKLKWKCKEGHSWWEFPSNIKAQGRWCSVCAKESRRAQKGLQEIEAMRMLAISKNGKCISNT